MIDWVGRFDLLQGPGLLFCKVLFGSLIIHIYICY